MTDQFDREAYVAQQQELVVMMCAGTGYSEALAYAEERATRLSVGASVLLDASIAVMYCSDEQQQRAVELLHQRAAIAPNIEDAPTLIRDAEYAFENGETQLSESLQLVCVTDFLGTTEPSNYVWTKETFEAWSDITSRLTFEVLEEAMWKPELVAKAIAFVKQVQQEHGDNYMHEHRYLDFDYRLQAVFIRLHESSNSTPGLADEVATLIVDKERISEALTARNNAQMTSALLANNWQQANELTTSNPNVRLEPFFWAGVVSGFMNGELTITQVGAIVAFVESRMSAEELSSLHFSEESQQITTYIVAGRQDLADVHLNDGVDQEDYYDYMLLLRGASLGYGLTQNREAFEQNKARVERALRTSPRKQQPISETSIAGILQLHDAIYMDAQNYLPLA